MGWGWRDATCGNSSQSFLLSLSVNLKLLKKKKKKKYSLIVKKTKNKKESSTCPCSKTPFLFCLNRHWLASYYQSQGASFHLPSIQSVQRPETKKTYLNSKPGGNNWQGLGKQLARTRKQQEPRNHPVLPSPTQSPGGPSLHRP